MALLGETQRLVGMYREKTLMDNRASAIMSSASETRAPYNWFPFKQAYPSEFLKYAFLTLLDSSSVQKVLDPFMGSGNTLLACLEFGKEGYGMDVSPFFHFVSRVKTRKYVSRDFDDALDSLQGSSVGRLFNALKSWLFGAPLKAPSLSSFDRLFDPEVLRKCLYLLYRAGELCSEAQDILLFALASEILEFSRAKREGKGLHIIKRDVDVEAVPRTVQSKLRRMKREHAMFWHGIKNPDLAHPMIGDAREVHQNRYVPKFDAVVTSPPYCNSADYIEMYKLEHWLLGFVESVEEFRDLSLTTFRSHQTVRFSGSSPALPAVEEICDFLRQQKRVKWVKQKRIDRTIKAYFCDLEKFMISVRAKINKPGQIILVLGNSAYAGKVVPTDLLACEIAETHGFDVKSIRVARNLRSSSQQTRLLDERNKSLLRESVLVLESS